MVWAGAVSGQPIAFTMGQSRQVAYGSIGFDQALIMPTLGYGRVLQLARRPVLLTVDASVPPTLYGLHNRRYRVAGRTNLLPAGRFMLLLGLEPTVSYGRNQTYDALTYSTALSLTPALWAGRWTVAVEGYYNHGWATHLTNRPAYRANYPAAQDGWYKNPSGTLRGGLALGYRFRQSEFTLRLDYQRNGQYDTYLPPYYGSIGINRRFGNHKHTTN